MNDVQKSTGRAQRLLRWYPASWRKRYGVEFVDLMEQEFVEMPHSFKRTSNIAYKGSIARLRELGLSSSTLNLEDQSEAVIATVFVASSIFAFLALNFWSVAMLNWNENWRVPASVATTLWTACVTVAAGMVVGLVLALFCALLWSASRRVRDRSSGVVGPLSVIASAVIFLGFSVRSALRFVIARGGIDWTRTGQAIKQLAGTTHALATTILWIWMSPRESLRLGSNVVYGLIPVALVILSISAAVLVRRTEFSIMGTRFGRFIPLTLALAMSLFIIAYFGLIASGNEVVGAAFGQPLSYPPLVIEFGFMMLMSALGIRGARQLSKNSDSLRTDVA